MTDEGGRDELGAGFKREDIPSIHRAEIGDLAAPNFSLGARRGGQAGVLRQGLAATGGTAALAFLGVAGAGRLKGRDEVALAVADEILSPHAD